MEKESVSPVSNVCAVILAGGKSSRMGGTNKALLKIMGKSIIERQIEILDEIFSETIIITNSPDCYKFLGKPTFMDIIPGKASLGGLHSGLMSANKPYCFFVACDMPFLNREIINLLLVNVDAHDIVIPKISGRFEPLHAIYSRKCIPFIENLISSDNLQIFGFFEHVDVCEIKGSELRKIDPLLNFTININTPEDLEKATGKLILDRKNNGWSGKPR